MSATDYLWLVFTAMPVAFFFDLLTFTFGIWWLRRWRRVRAQAKDQENALDH